MRRCLCGHAIASHFDGGGCLDPACGCLIVEPLLAGWKSARVPRREAKPGPAPSLPRPRLDIELPDWAHR